MDSKHDSVENFRKDLENQHNTPNNVKRYPIVNKTADVNLIFVRNGLRYNIRYSSQIHQIILNGVFKLIFPVDKNNSTFASLM